MKIKSLCSILMYAVTLLVFVVPSVFAQTGGTGALTGTVTDASGSAVANANVTLTNVGTSQARTTMTDGSGSYKFNLLPPGEYRVKFEATGFQAVDVPSVNVNVTETQTLDRRLAVGAQVQEVTVQADAEQIQTTTAAVGTVIAARTVTDLPLSTRNYINLISLSTGAAAPVQNATAIGRGSQTTVVNGSIGGHQNNYMMDGATVTDLNADSCCGEGGTMSNFALPNPDAIQEFKIQTSNYDASYGRGSGASVNVITRSGTNQLHGSAFEFLRNTAFNANDYFFKTNNPIRPKFVLNQNQFGGTIGGPLKKDKLFFFGSYQQTKQVNGSSLGASTAVLPAIPAGDRSTQGWLDSMYNLYCHVRGANGGVAIEPPPGSASTCTPVASPTSATVPINPVALNILRLKLPDGSYYVPSGPGGTATYTAPALYHQYQAIFNGDYIINSKHSLSARWMYANDPEEFNFVVTNSLPNGGGFIRRDPGTIAKLTLTSTLSNNIVNVASVAYQRDGLYHSITPPPGGTSFTNTQVGMGVLNPLTPLLSQFQIGGFSIGNYIFGLSAMQTNQTEWADQLSWSHGKHTIRMGYEIGFYQRRYDIGLNINQGSMVINTFNDFLVGLAGCTPGNAACTPLTPGGTNGTSQSNIASSGSATKTGSVLDSNGNPTVTNPSDNRSNTQMLDHSAYIQDDFKVNGHLMLNLGLRYDYFPYLTEKEGKLTNIWLSQLKTVPFPLVAAPCVNPANGLPTTFPSPCPGGSYIGYVIPANYDTATLGATPPGVLQNTLNSAPRSRAPLDNFSPRLGIAWQPFQSSKLVVRAGGGFFYYRLDHDAVYIPIARQAPFAAGKSGVGTGNYFASLAAPLSQVIGWQTRWYTAAGATSNIIQQELDENFHTPLTYSYNANIQYQFLPTWMVEVGYVGTHAIHQFIGGANGGIPYNPALLASPTNPVNCGYNGGDPSNIANCITTSTTSNVALRVPYLGYAATVGNNSPSYSGKYNSLQATVRKQLSHGVTTAVSYTWAKALTSTYQGINAAYPIAQVYGPNANYRPQRLTATYSWDLPLGHPNGFLAKKLVEGWTVAGITTIQNGNQLTITDSRGGTIYGTPAGTGAGSSTTAQFSATGNNGNVQTQGKVVDRVNNYFDTTAFVTPPAATSTNLPGFCAVACTGTIYGNSGIGITRGPNQNNWDMTVAKITTVGGLRESATLEFRAEFFNTFNHTQFSNPAVSAASAGTFGKITSTAVSPRIMQFALKYKF